MGLLDYPLESQVLPMPLRLQVVLVVALKASRERTLSVVVPLVARVRLVVVKQPHPAQHHSTVKSQLVAASKPRLKPEPTPSMPTLVAAPKLAAKSPLKLK